MATRNSEALASLVAYCESHPEQRLWQAIRNWSKYDFIMGFEGDLGDLWNLRDVANKQGLLLEDTWSIEGLNGTRQTDR